MTQLRALIVGESWGEREDAFKHALVGPSGVETADMLRAAGMTPTLVLRCAKCTHRVPFLLLRPSCPDCKARIWPSERDLIDHWRRIRAEASVGITNVFNERPEHNELGHFFGNEPATNAFPRWKPSKKVGGAWIKHEHLHHLDRLYDEIADTRPNVILGLGNASCWALLGQVKITDLRGTFHWSTKCNVKVVPTFHPAAMMRQYPLRPTIIADMNKAHRESGWPEIRRPQRFFTIPYPDSRGIDEIREWMARPAEAYASDIETAHGQISIIGFARNESDALVIPFHSNASDFLIDLMASAGLPPATSPSFWPTAQLEAEAWKLSRAGLKRKIRKIGQNYLYDLTYLWRDGILPDVSAGMDDTMLWHHAHFPEMRKGLGYLGSIYCDEISWKPLGRANELKRDE